MAAKKTATPSAAKAAKRSASSAATRTATKPATERAAGEPTRSGTKRSAPGTGQKRSALPGEDPGTLIDQRIAELGGWRGEMLGQLRAIIRAADPAVVEEWKWGIPVWSHDGIICTGETYKAVVKLTFARGASLADPAKLFNSSLEGATRRAIDVREGERVDAKALGALVREAARANGAARGAKGRKKTRSRSTR